MLRLLDGPYLCQITGQDVESINEIVCCPEINGSGDCKLAPQLTACSVYLSAKRAYAQSQPLCLEEEQQYFEKMKEGIPLGQAPPL